MKYWLIADRPNKAKKCGPFFGPCPDFMGGDAPPPIPTPVIYCCTVIGLIVNEDDS